MSRALRIALALLAACHAATAAADVFKPAYLELRETDENRYEVLLKVPTLGGEDAAALEVQFPPGTLLSGDARTQYLPGAVIRRWAIERPGGLEDQTVGVVDVSSAITDVLARVERLDGTTQVEELSPRQPAFVVREPASVPDVALTYLVLGFEHILGGVDHLLFVLALLLVVSGGTRIFYTITAFTVAHSLTLVAATLGWLSVPGPPVEAVIALSIMFVAGEAVHGLRGRPGLTARAPWIVAFVFGLLHGLGFAGALAEVGLPQTAVPMALLMFNVGVELGQLAFVAAALALGAALARVARVPHRALYVPPYAIGSLAMFWVAERTASFFAL